MNKILNIFAAVLLLSSCGKAETSKLVIETETGDITYNVETASTVKELETGLMNRDSLSADGGMLFDLSNVPNKVTAMWMKDTKLSLDMIFLTKEGVIYWIKENAQPYSEELIIAPFPAAAVLEINAGETAKHKIKIGQRVKHNLFKMSEHNQPAVQEPAAASEKAVREDEVEPVAEADSSAVPENGAEQAAEVSSSAVQIQADEPVVQTETPEEGTTEVPAEENTQSETEK